MTRINITRITPDGTPFEVYESVEVVEARRDFMLDAIPEPIADAFWATICVEGACDHLDGDYDELLEQVFVSWLLDEDADIYADLAVL